MWTTVPVSEHHGPHAVFVPKGFGKQLVDFPTAHEFLQALRDFYKANTKPQLRLI